MTLRLLAASLFSFLGGAGEVMAEAPASPASTGQPATFATAGIIAGDTSGTGIHIASDLSRLLDGNGLRVIPIIGKGSVEDINDLLTLKVADMAIVQSDVMAHIMSGQPGLQSNVKYVAKLHSEEFYVLSRMQFLCLADLNGRQVSFGPKDSGAAITAKAVFEASGVSPDPLNLEQEEAIERLKRGKLDALVYVGGKPSHVFDGISHKDKVHFLDVEYLRALQGNYLPAIITPEDYPNLVAPNESVATVGVSYVLAIRDQPAQSERYKVMARLAEKLLSDFGRVKEAGFSPKWSEVNLRAPVKGLQRFEPAALWLSGGGEPAAASAPPAAQMKTILVKFVESQKSASTDQEELFNRFVLWYREYGVQAPLQR
jgi:uncharacterized protein